MTLVQMKYFALVGELLSFTKAAQALHVTQPAVSSAMRTWNGSAAWPSLSATRTYCS